MFQKNAKHRANDASNDVHRPPLYGAAQWLGAPGGQDGSQTTQAQAQASNGGMQEMLRKNGNDWRETMQRGIWIWGQKSQKKWKARSKSGCVVLLEEKIGRV